MPRICLLLAIFLLVSCSNKEKTVPSESLEKETHHFFSTNESKDQFVLEFRYSDPRGSKNEYTYFDILSGKLRLTIYDQTGEQIFRHNWAVSDCFSMADNHYLNEDQKRAWTEFIRP